MIILLYFRKIAAFFAKSAFCNNSLKWKNKVGCTIYSFICLYAGAMEWYPSFSATILLLCTSRGDISASAICYFWGFFLVHYYIGRPLQTTLGASVAFTMEFISLCSLCCNIPSANDSEVVDCGHEHTLLWSLIFL